MASVGPAHAATVAAALVAGATSRRSDHSAGTAGSEPSGPADRRSVNSAGCLWWRRRRPAKPFNGREVTPVTARDTPAPASPIGHWFFVSLVIMATRAPKGSTRPRGGGSGEFRAEPDRPARRKPAASSGRSGAARSGTGPKSGRTGGSAANRNRNRGRGGGRPAARTRKGASGRRPQSRRPTHDPVVILVQWIGQAIAAAWMVAASPGRLHRAPLRPQCPGPRSRAPPGRYRAALAGRGHRAGRPASGGGSTTRSAGPSRRSCTAPPVRHPG